MQEITTYLWVFWEIQAVVKMFCTKILFQLSLIFKLIFWTPYRDSLTIDLYFFLMIPKTLDLIYIMKYLIVITQILILSRKKTNAFVSIMNEWLKKILFQNSHYIKINVFIEKLFQINNPIINSTLKQEFAMHLHVFNAIH